ncbi:MAG: serine--tRNA ligase [Alphaproteobacteria bacterium]|nr:serine--tRNA ligase [Alphaproteobacteria bacterium]
MHDIKFIRQNPEAFDAGLARRGLDPRAQFIIAADEADRKRKQELEELLARRNSLAKEIGQAKAKGMDVADILSIAASVNDVIAAQQNMQPLVQQELKTTLETLPNLPADDVPQGKDENDNIELRVVGEKPKMDFVPKLHDDLGVALGLMDFDGAAKLSGARFVVLKGALARMERALASFMLDSHTAFGYTEHVTPALVRRNAMYGTGQLPKFAGDLFATQVPEWRETAQELDRLYAKTYGRIQEDGTFAFPSENISDNEQEIESLRNKLLADHLYLIPTAEVTLTNLVADSILEEEQLPIRMTAYTQCFRSEAGAAGKDTRGMIRQHQFAKVELVSVVHPDQSAAEHERMTGAAEEILKKLGLHYRVIVLCTGDMGFSAQKTYDIEVWLPGQSAFREISSCSNCGPFQARRMKARFKAKGAKETQFLHTLNGSGLAIGRTMVAILENYQNADGSITVPPALRPYMGGLEVIK